MADALNDLRDSAARELTLAVAGDADERTKHLRAVAALFIEAREHIPLKDESADLRGASYRYKQFVAEVYGLANVPPADRQRLQGSVSYHVSSIMRERYGADEMSAHGMQSTSYKERNRLRREQETHIVRIFDSADGLDDDDLLPMLRGMQSALRRLHADHKLPALEKAVSAALKRAGDAPVAENVRVPVRR